MTTQTLREPSANCDCCGADMNRGDLVIALDGHRIVCSTPCATRLELIDDAPKTVQKALAGFEGRHCLPGQQDLF